MENGIIDIIYILKTKKASDSILDQVELDIEEMKKIIILSLQPEPYYKIIEGVKKHEFRRKFLNKPVDAFIYVSSPIKEIKGFFEFGQPVFDRVQKIGEIAESEGSGTINGIHNYMKGLEKGYAIPILSIREIESIPLNELRTKYKFTAPQSYLNIEAIPLLKDDLMKRWSYVKKSDKLNVETP